MATNLIPVGSDRVRMFRHEPSLYFGREFMALSEEVYDIPNIVEIIERHGSCAFFNGFYIGEINNHHGDTETEYNLISIRCNCGWTKEFYRAIWNYAWRGTTIDQIVNRINNSVISRHHFIENFNNMVELEVQKRLNAAENKIKQDCQEIHKKCINSIFRLEV